MNEERPIEKLLRRYAKKRRDEAGPVRDLHPATRRILQSEVARQFPKPASKERSAFDEFVAAFGRRWIYAVSVLVVLMAVAAVMLPTLSKSKSKTHLAKNELESPAEAMTPLAPAASVATPKSAALDELAFTFETNSVASVASAGLADNSRDELVRSRLGADRDFRAGGGNIAVATDLVEKTPSAPPAFETSGALFFGAKQEAQTSLVLGGNSGTWNATVANNANTDLTVNTTKGSVANSLSFDKTWLARGGLQEKDAEISYRQNFANDQPLAKKVMAVSGEAKVITPVLANFQIEQSGNKLRVIDGDGSTYHGEVAPELAYGLAQNAAYKSDGRQKLAGEQRADQQQQAVGAYQFRVEGTNRTLNQQVVFSWNCVPITNALAFSNSSLVASEFKKFDAAKMPQQFPGFQNALINGRAQIASEKEIEINARPVAE